MAENESEEESGPAIEFLRQVCDWTSHGMDLFLRSSPSIDVRDRDGTDGPHYHLFPDEWYYPEYPAEGLEQRARAVIDHFKTLTDKGLSLWIVHDEARFGLSVITPIGHSHFSRAEPGSAEDTLRTLIDDMHRNFVGWDGADTGIPLREDSNLPADGDQAGQDS